MLLYLLVGACACAAAWLYLTWLRVKTYWAERGVPHLPPHPILGSLTFLQRKNPAQWLRDLYKFKSPYVGVWFLWRPGLVVNSPELAHRILVKDFNNFRNRYLSSSEKDSIGALNLLTVNDPIWSSLRHRLSPVFSGAKLKILQDYIGSKSKELAQRIRNEKDNLINLKEMFVDFATDIIGTSAFGVESNATLTGKGPMRAITHEFGKFSIFRGLSWSSIFFFPDVVDFFGFTFFPKSSMEYFKKMYRTIAKQREESTTQRASKDLLDALLKLKHEKLDNNEPITEDMLISQAAIFLLGGFETSGSVLAFTTYELAYNSEIQDKLHRELRAAEQRKGNKDFDMQTLSELTYLNCVIKEGLRKYSPMGWLDRVALADYKIDDKVTVTAGMPVYVNNTGIHSDPEHFPDPKKFDPDRFLPENEDNIKQYTYMPFGEGPRFCIGMRFAQITLRYALASVFLNYCLRPLPNKPKPTDVKIDTRCILFVPGEPLLVQFIPRQ